MTSGAECFPNSSRSASPERELTAVVCSVSGEPARQLPQMLQGLINDLPEQIAILDDRCIIVAINEAWKAATEGYGYSSAAPGHSYRDFCANAAANGYQPGAQAVIALDDICAGRRTYWDLTYNGGPRWGGHDFQICFHRLNEEDAFYVLVTRFELTELNELRRTREQVHDAFHDGQMLERQRVARELHDSTAQLLASAGLLLGHLRQHSTDSQTLEVVEELQDVLTEAQREIRLMAYLAHPPAVEKLGLAGALQAIAEGFERRTGLKTSFETVGSPVALAAPVQVALYRISQEALANVHRHAHATQVSIQLCHKRTATHLVIGDDGIGIPRDTLAGCGRSGVGLASMRNRLSEIGGRFTVLRASSGTAIIASVKSNESRGRPGLTLQPKVRI